MIIWQPGMTIDDVEKLVIHAALSFHSGNKTKTADSLNIAIRTLDNKLARYRQEEETKLPTTETKENQ
jgi:transcriptional regulator with PAS, ATPase and Fis domain